MAIYAEEPPGHIQQANDPKHNGTYARAVS